MKKLAVAVTCLIGFACTPQIDNELPPESITARFDPSAVPAVVPSPNDLATHPATGLLAVPIPDNASAVDREFLTYLNTLDGFPLGATASTAFTGTLDDLTVNSTAVKVFNLDGLTEVMPAAIAMVATGDQAAPARLNISPPAGGWKPGNRYGVVILGGSTGLKGATGLPVVGSATWAFIRSDSSLLTCAADGTCRASTEIIPSSIKNDAAARLADQTSSARRLEALRLKYKPLIDKVAPASGSVPRSDVVIAWSFRATTFTQLQFNPSTSPPKVPTPNDLAINPQTGLVNAPIDDAGTAAQQEFTRDYLNTLNGFPVSATATAEVAGGDLDPASITASTVFVVPLSGGPLAGAPSSSYEQATKTLKIAPFGGSWGKGRSLAVVVVGGKNGVKRVGGATVVGTEFWAIVRSANPLVTCDDLTSVECKVAITAAPLTLTQALGLEAVRRSYKPVLDAIGVPRADVALMWVFRTVNQPEATFDPALQIIPFPNNLLTVRLDDGGTRVNLPVPTAAGLQQQLVMGLNTLDGFSLTAMAVSENSDTRAALDQGAIDPLTLTLGGDGGTSGFAKLAASGSLRPQVSVCLDCASSKLPDGGSGVFFPDGGALVPAPQQLQFVPQRPLEEKTNYAAWITTALKDTTGRKVMAAPAFALLRSKASLIEAGKSTISGVSDGQAAALEPARAALKPMFDALEAQGVPRKSLALAFSYRTQSTVSVLQQLNALPGALPEATALPSSVNDISAQIPAALIPNVNVFQAQVPLPFILTGVGQTLNPPLGLPQFRRAPALITIPKGAPAAGGFPVLIFGHGLGSDRNSALRFSNTAAMGGFATVAIDVIYHGERTTCVGSSARTMAASDDASCANDVTAQCDPTSGRCVARGTFVPAVCVFGADGLTGDLGCQAVGQGLCLSTNVCEGGDFKRTAAGSPSIAAWNFLNLSNFFTTRDNFRYAPLDFAMLIKILKVPATTAGSLAARLAVADPNAVLNTGSINYLGMSLGGFNGALASAVNPDLKYVGLNVPGSDQVQVVLTAPAFANERNGFLATLASLGLRPGMPAFDQFMVLARMIIDPADPQNAIWTGVNQSIPPGRKVYIQYIENDPVIPNETTVKLIDAANQTLARQAYVTLARPAAAFPVANRHSYLLLCPGDDTATPNPDCDAARTKAHLQLSTFLQGGVPAP